MINKKSNQFLLCSTIFILLFSFFQAQNICKQDSGLKSPLDVFFYFIKTHIASLNPITQSNQLDLVFHYTSANLLNYFIFKENSSPNNFFYGFEMGNQVNGIPSFLKIIKHNNLNVIKIVLGLDTVPINPSKSICENLIYELTDYKRYNLYLYKFIYIYIILLSLL